MEEKLKYLPNILRLGTVMDVDRERRMARVIYTGTKIPSGWLKVLASPPFIPDDVTEPQRTELRAGGSGSGAFDEHFHEVRISPWLPRVNDKVLCLFFPVFNGDGFILGGIG